MTDSSSPRRVSRRNLLRASLVHGGLIGGAVWLGQFAGQAADLWRQHEAWQEAGLPNDRFFAGRAADLQRLNLGASFAPEQWSLDPAGQEEARRALQLVQDELTISRLRLGLRWSRVQKRSGEIDLRGYQPLIDQALAGGAEVCLNIGPVKTFRWPEEHVPRYLLASLEQAPAPKSTLRLGQPLVERALDYLDHLLQALRHDYGPGGFAMIQVENEPFYPLGEHAWRLDRHYLQAVAERVADAFPRSRLLVTSAGRLNLNDVRDLLVRLMQKRPELRGRLVSGFDFHYRTPLRDSYPLVRHFDQISYARPFAPSCEAHIDDARQAGFGIEVTEGQAEPYQYFTEPGNSARDFRYMLVRCLDNVLDPRQPALIRIWGVEELAKKMLRGSITDEHRAIIDLVQAVNGGDGAAAARPTERGS